MNISERFVIPLELFGNHPEEGITIVRLGALANAISAASGMMVASLATGVGQERDVLQASLLITSYFKEAVDTINTKFSWRLIEAGAGSGYRLPLPLDDLKRLFSRGDDSLYKRGVTDIRRTKGFHVDEDHFREWLAQLQSPFVTLWRKDSGSALDWAFTASAQIQSFFGTKLDDTAGLEVVKAASYLMYLVEAMTWGLLAESGADPATWYRRMAPREIRFEYSFYDGRNPFCDTRIVVMDMNGDFNSVVHELRDHVTRIFGGRRAGAMIPVADAPIGFSSDKGTARAWLGRPVQSSPDPLDERGVLLRMKGMARWGAHTAKRSLAFAEAVRAGTVTPEQATTLVTELIADLEFWRIRQQESDELAFTSRDRA